MIKIRIVVRKVIGIGLLILCISKMGSAQFANDWIRPSQQYFKLGVAKDGIYRLTYDDLLASGFPMSSDNNRIQLFHRGKELHIRVVKSNAGVSQLQSGDYIEFFGIKNNGELDADLYEPSNSQPHQYYSLFNDTTYYFLTVNTQGQLGKRMDSFFEINDTNISPESFHTDEKLTLLTNQYATGVRYNESGGTYIQNSYFQTGEGWTGEEIVQGATISYTIENINNASVSSGQLQLEIQLVGRTRGQHPFEIAVGPTAGTRVVSSGTFDGFNAHVVNTAINWGDVGSDGKMVVQVRALTGSGTAFRLSASYIKINYPQTFNVALTSEKVFILNEKVSNKSFIQLQNAPVGTRVFDITNRIQPRLIGTTLTTTLNAVINNTSTTRKIFATSIFNVPTIKRVRFRGLVPIQHNYIIISHSTLMNSAGGYDNPVKAYAGYRASTEGGGYDTLVLDMQQVYNQFNYGEVSPLALRNFAKFMFSTGNPNYLFLIGKGLEIRHSYHRNPTNPALNGYHDLVPTAGEPASDILFTSGLGEAIYEPAIATGRLSASTPKQVADYLNKVKQMDALPFDALWRKNILHLSGGKTSIEQSLFKFYLEYLGQKAEDFYLGGSIASIAKNSVDQERFDINTQVNNGLQLVTMFGHSGTTTGEINVGYATAPELGFNNNGKYPMFLSNGCNAGDFFSPDKRWPEDWVFAQQKGAIAFMANTGYGYSDVLNYYSNTLYNIAYRDNGFFNKGIGDVQKEVVKRMINGLNEESDTLRYLAQAHQMFLLGDPAVKLFGATLPDYEINNESVFAESFNAESITALSDSFAIKLVVRNFGKAPADSLRVRVTRTFGENQQLTYDSLYPPVLYRDTLILNIPRVEGGFGDNFFSVAIDPDNERAELNEDNNIGEFSLLIPSNASRNLFPQNFAIVNTNTVTLTVQSAVLGDEPRDFIIELDTIPTFNSPWLKHQVAEGTIATYQFDLLTATDTLAYYWRSKLAQAKPEESNNWTTASFTYIKNGSEGWGQVHFPQLLSNGITSMVLNSANSKLEFIKMKTPVYINTAGSLAEGYTTITQFGETKTYHSEFSVKVGGTEYHPISLILDNSNTPCVINTFNAIAFNRSTTQPYIHPDFFSTVRACGRRPEVIASFKSSNINTYLPMYIDYVAEGDSVILFSIGNPQYSEWSAAVKNKLGELGISLAQLSSIEDGEPVFILGKKGAAAGTAIILRSDAEVPPQQTLLLDKDITGRATTGVLTSTRIGPAVSWQNFYNKTKISEFPQTDNLSFDVIGITLNGEETTLKSDIVSIQEDISDIDATEFPYIRIDYKVSDEINLTPAQLKNWIVTYTPAPEGIIVYNGSTEQQVVNEGEVWNGDFSFQNISQKQFSGPLTVQYSVNNTTQRRTFDYNTEIQAPLPGQKTDFNLSINTLEKVGLNNVRVFVNPRLDPELYYDNNIAELKNLLKVEGDEISPVLDVTIDGRYIKNGDYVSANPVVNFQLWDENTLILKTDTLGIVIFLNERQLFFKNFITWTPATTTASFSASFIPENLTQGDYELAIRATDARNNEVEYTVTFMVAEDNTILISKPYPNPSNSSFFIDITITGDNHPDGAFIQIMNLTGGILGEFKLSDFYTGTNTLVWDSADTYGNQLPDGLYIYRIILNKDGAQLKTSSGKIILRR